MGVLSKMWGVGPSAGEGFRPSFRIFSLRESNPVIRLMVEELVNASNSVSSRDMASRSVAAMAVVLSELVFVGISFSRALLETLKSW